ncbi:hypothetical protein GT037_008809 [Alternaria burnsii]|uniref:Uncharacterized protein n=1 Tax=Alternaria burnsii TaxID=1187904 RepID=A0A8H7B4U6_9PLEO|nr:uncharacterized protein GT037_008809 [Alternaria burnsii]KAF7672858.1 hypothetical protein GT037_008809 [Alternaria burnsii]
MQASNRTHRRPLLSCSEDTESSTSILSLRTRNLGTYTPNATPGVKIAHTRAHMEPNVYKVISPYQATRELLENLAHEPMSVPTGSSAELLG